jgi:hypothetical protein
LISARGCETGVDGNVRPRALRKDPARVRGRRGRHPNDSEGRTDDRVIQRIYDGMRRRKDLPLRSGRHPGGVD